MSSRVSLQSARVNKVNAGKESDVSFVQGVDLEVNLNFEVSVKQEGFANMKLVCDVYPKKESERGLLNIGVTVEGVFKSDGIVKEGSLEEQEMVALLFPYIKINVAHLSSMIGMPTIDLPLPPPKEEWIG